MPCWMRYIESYANKYRLKEILLGAFQYQMNCYAESSVTNGPRPSLRVRVLVGTKPSPNWLSGSSINPNCRFGYGSINICQPVSIGRVLSGSSSWSMCKYIYGTGLCYLIMVLIQYRLFDNHECHFGCFLGCEIHNI
jgi:hypothetical protein